MGPAGHSLAALAAAAGAPLGAAALVLRPSLRAGLRERLRGPDVQPGPGAVWVHGASVGEIGAALPLVDLLRARGEAVLASTMTLTGRARVRAARPDLPSALAPLDHPWAVAAALRRVRPSALVLVETELWPSWIAAARARGAAVLIVSGRISDRSLPRYRRLRRLVAPTLRRLCAIGARSEEDADRFVALGAPPQRVSITGDLKLEGAAEPAALAPDLAAALAGAPPLLVAGSTHPGEEDAALAALEAAERRGLRAALVLAPRRPERFDEVAERVVRSGRRLRRRSRLAAAAGAAAAPAAQAEGLEAEAGRPAGSGASLGAGEVLLLDSLGELGAVYGRAAVAFVGGTLAPVGGHNLLEPVQQGRPVLFGPHVANVRAAETLLRETGAGRRVAGADELVRAAAELLADPGAAAALGARGRRALEAHRGAAARSLALLDAVRAARVGREGGS